MVLSHTLEPITLFFSFAHEDESLFRQLYNHLMPLIRRGLIHVSYDSMISAGSDAMSTTRSFLWTADIIVFLISSDFFASDQCIEMEVPCALEQYTIRATPVLNVLLRPTAWISPALAHHALLPPNGKAVSLWDNQDSAIVEVAKGIYRVIERLMQRLTDVPLPVKPPHFPLFALPYRRNPFFTDREETLATLRTFFLSQTKSETRIQMLSGLGGMGKTLLAIEYAYRYQDAYQVILWLRAAPAKLLSSDLLSLARQLGIPAQDEVDERQRIVAIQRWLQHQKHWLVILDNLQDPSFLKQLLPLYSDGHVLLTAPFQAELSPQIVSVAPLNLEESTLLLLRRAGIIPAKGLREAASEEDYQHASLLAQELEGYPLAIDQAGSYIQETQHTPASYLTLYTSHQAKLLGRRGRFAPEHPNPVTTTLALTFEKIAQLHPAAQDLLYFLAFLYPEALPNEMIRDGMASLTGPLQTLAADPVAYDAALQTLLTFSLLSHRADRTTLTIHRVIQTTLRKHLTKKQQVQLAKQAVRLVHRLFPEIRFATRKVCERYLPQALHCASLLHEFQLRVKEGPLLLERLGSYYSLYGCYPEAETYLTQALHLQGQRSRGDSALTAQILNSLGLLSQRQADFPKAEMFHRQALEFRQQTFGPSHPITMESLHNLALVYGDQGDYQHAEQIYLTVIAVEEQAKGTQHPDLARTLNNLALMYYHQGRYMQAQPIYQRALAIYEHSFPPDHPDSLYPLDGLGALAEVQGDYLHAEEFYQRAYTLCKHAFGEAHPETAHCINKLADIAELKGAHQEAEIRYQQALSLGEQALGPEHPDIALFLNNLAFLVHRQGQHERALELYQRALSIDEQALGPTHPAVADVLNNLGKLYSSMNEKERAEKLLRRSIAIYEERLPPTHPDIAQGLSDLADLLVTQRRYAEAESFFQRALALLSDEENFEHPEAHIIREKYASLLESIERSEDAALLRRTRLQQAGPGSGESS